MDKKEAYRDGIKMWTKGEVFYGLQEETIEVLYTDDGEKKFFVELSGIPACAHGDTIEDAILDAKEKRGEFEPLTDEQRKEYSAKNFRFTVSLFRRLTKACRSGIKEWLNQRHLDDSVTMTLKEFREAGGGEWADRLEESLK